ncbi:MAG: UDP-N-acetylmuramate dehydrogenase [Clostridiales bacterium]|jgi:UDP-N-acetylmuramate dehydrogenase|nr:UDP-N-acetylmuramate dehydrogenase [Clostridiales bacterium]
MPLQELLRPDQILPSEPLKNHTSFRIGGPADLLVLPENAKELSEVLECLQSGKERFMVIGNGSNLLFSDLGFRGTVIKIAKNMSLASHQGVFLEAFAGISLAALAAKALSLGLTGLEFASGIPGTLGGAIFMNAGAYGGEMKDVVAEASVITPDGARSLNASDLKFGYRHSALSDSGDIVASAKLKLAPGDKEEISRKMDDLNSRRRDKQPLDLPSAGSTFKRPEGHFAGKLIMDAGLRGFSCGGAQVSQKHCGFVVNKGGASAKDVLELIKRVQDEVEKQFGVFLETEIKIVPEK